jgi:hypothetical protein
VKAALSQGHAIALMHYFAASRLLWAEKKSGLTKQTKTLLCEDDPLPLLVAHHRAICMTL